jgi:mevalonate kinase
MITVSAPAKVILLGEHAVVHGQPAIAVPISGLRATATIDHSSSTGSGLHIVAADMDEALPIDIESVAFDNALAFTARLVLETLGVPPPDTTIIIRSDIPIASGLGSGAAVSTVLGRALSVVTGVPLEPDALNNLVYEIEKIHHGQPSGIDNTVIVYEQPVYFVRGQSIETITIGQPFTLLIGDTGRGALTRVAVEDVRKLLNAQPETIGAIIEAVGALVVEARAAIERGDMLTLGRLMTSNHYLLQQLTVSSPELDQLVAAALAAGALGAKLSGGGRGGNMIALAQPDHAEAVGAALLNAGAVRVFSTVVGQSG